MLPHRHFNSFPARLILRWCFMSAFVSVAGAQNPTPAPPESQIETKHSSTTSAPPDVADKLFAVGAVYLEQGDYAKAMDYYLRSLRQHEQHGASLARISSVIGGVGAIYYLKGEYAEAMEWHWRGLKMAEESGERWAIAFSHFNIAADYRMQGDFASALENYERSMKLREEFTDYDRAMSSESAGRTTLRHIATTYYMQGNYALALNHYGRCLSLDEKMNDAAGIAHSLSYIGGVYRSQGHYKQALDYLGRSLRTFESLGYRDGQARTLAIIGSVHYLQGDAARALNYFNSALALRELLDAKEGIAGALLNIALVHAINREPAKALDAATRSADLARRIGSRHVLWNARLVAGRVLRSLNRLTEARQAFDESIAVVEAMRAHVAGGEQEQEQFFADKIAPYYEVVEMLVRERKREEALTYVEQGKARALLDVLRGGRANFAGRTTKDEQARERELKGALNALGSALRREQSATRPRETEIQNLQTRLERARLDHAAFQTSLYSKYPELCVERGEVNAITLPETMELLPDAATAIIEYVVTDDRTYLFVITKPENKNTEANALSRPSLKIYAIEQTRAELATRVAIFRRQLAGRDLLFRANAKSLYELLLKPAEAELRGKKHIVIVPDNDLWELPFQALQTTTGGYFIEQAAISYAPSLTVLREMMRKRRKRSPSAAEDVSLLAFGNPVLDTNTVRRAQNAVMMEGGIGAPKPLPEAERQVKLLARLYGARHSRIYTRAEAREERAKQEAHNYRILHFATHGTLNDSSPMYSHIMLAPGNEKSIKGTSDVTGENGLLEAWELMEMNLRADLVVLSACETARGRLTAGEGMIGLSWALFVVGSPTTVEGSSRERG